MSTPEASGRPRRQEAEPASEEVTEVAPGILRMQLPIALAGLGHVNCYAFEDERGYTVVDPGMPDPDTFAVLERRLADAGARSGAVHTVIVTHGHVDHFGGAGRLRIRNGAEVVAHRRFKTFFDLMEQGEGPLQSVGESAGDVRSLLLEGAIEEAAALAWTTPWGKPLETSLGQGRTQMLAWDRESIEGALYPSPTRLVDDGERLHFGGREWTVLHTPGHTGDHACFLDADSGVLLSGDHVLPSITPHISGMAEMEDPLQHFFAALDRVGQLEGVGLVLPAHGHPFDDLTGRVADIRSHHQARLRTIVDIGAAEGRASLTTFCHELFPERSWGQMADSEAYAHLEHLRLRGVARRTVGSDGEVAYEIDAGMFD